MTANLSNTSVPSTQEAGLAYMFKKVASTAIMSPSVTMTLVHVGPMRFRNGLMESA